MREKYESLSLAELKEVAKFRGLRGVSAMKKADIVNAMLELDEKERLHKEEMASTQAAASEHTASERPTTAEKPPASEKPTTAEKLPASERPATAEKPSASERPSATERASAPERSSAAERPTAPGKAAPGRTGANRTAGKRTVGRPGGRISVSRSAEKHSAQEQPAEEKTVDPGYGTGRQEAPTQAQVEEAAAQQMEFAQTAPRKSFENGGSELDSGVEVRGILEVMPDGFGFIRSDNYMPGDQDVYVSPNQIRRFNLKTGDVLCGNTRVKIDKEKYRALLYVKNVNGYHPDVVAKRPNFEDLTPIFPDERLVMEHPGCNVAMRVMDLLSPVGKGQRGMIVSPPKAGKTTLLKAVAQAVIHNNPDVHLIILLIDERPEEVTDMKEAIQGHNVEVIHSTFDEMPEHHKRVAEMTIGRAKRLVEQKQDVCILLDSITRLTRAYNLTVQPSGRTLSGGLDPAALYMPKRFFGAARNMREGGSLTILATALVDTGSKMDDVVYEEFKGTGNMEIILDRKLSEKRIFPAIDIPKSGTRREDLLLSKEEQEAVTMLRRGLNGMKPDEAVDRILDLFSHTRNNAEFVQIVKKQRMF
ncbi:MAG: transcription termination factor Rho [Lachnospiraceae bacterium]|nr:transcription termination factor Rho [Lachnospiraceae bacterium]